MSIKRRLILIVTMVILGLITLYIVSSINQNNIAALNKIRFGLKDVQISLLQLRRNEIIADVEAIADMTVQVATAVEEQSAVVADVDRNIVRIRDIGEQVAFDSQNNSKASLDVANLAKELHKEANIFKV